MSDSIHIERTYQGTLQPADAPVEAPAPSRNALWITFCAIGIVLALLWIDRISVHKGVVWPAAERAIRLLFLPLETTFGAVPEDDASSREQVKVRNLLVGFVPAFLLYLAASGIVLFRCPYNDRKILQTILSWGIVFRVILVPFPPVLETDLHRYVWDGAVSANHVNPYKYAPVEVTKLADKGHRNLYDPSELAELDLLASLFEKHPGLAQHFPRINHASIPTIYPPLAQQLFSVAYRISPGSDVPIKLLVALVDLAICGMLVLVLGELRINRCNVILYAWSPLVLKEYANTGHYDPLATLMVLIALYQVLRRVPVLPGIALALGTASKFYPLVVTLVLAPWLGVLGLVTYALTLTMVYLPHLSIGLRVFDGLRAMARDWEFNSGVFALIEKGFILVVGKGWYARFGRRGGVLLASDDVVLDAFLFAKIACALIGLALVVWLLCQRPATEADAAHRAFAVTAALVLLSPVSDPWYFAWIMPFIAMFPAPSWIYLSGSMIIYYLYFWQYPWGYLPYARAIEYVPFYALLAGEHADRLIVAWRHVTWFVTWPFRRAADEIRALRGS